MPALSSAGGDRRASVAGLPAATGANTTSVKVVVRIRPNIGSDAANVPPRFQRIVVHPVSETTLSADNAGAVGAGAGPASPAAGPSGRAAKQMFTFDRVIGPTEGQPDVWDCAEPLVDSFLEGFNATILAYGQTSSGKSYTMGTDRMSDGILSDVQRQGITPRAVTEIFDRLAAAQREANGGLTFSAKVSYLEIYNEELIDLLAGNRDERPTVQIREDKQGNIFWSGLREVKVSSAHEVMDLLAAGSALRQTGETQMNAQSSRSHAILSLTVTQRKRTGSALHTPSAATPTSPPSPQHNRRLSAIPRVSSPAPPRAGTPTSDRPGSRMGLRPPSQLGRPATPQDSDGETWVNVTSKFHFVDLAGSERLKRTAATGDRAKEAVSINAGLSALGNVISALGDPTKKATHVPYRDSKLTRLLQDSLGGNARTMMVACVSPTEFNLQETLSTLKYANRARYIKNRADINETEAGWDDLEHLQRTIVKLRAEMAALKSGDVAHVVDRNGHAEVAVPGSVEAELQQKVAHLTAELAKAQSGELAAPGSPSPSSLSRDQFAAAVEPIVEEYERSLSALESQLALTKAALGHSEDEMRDLEARIEEEARTNEANTALIDELRLRVAKLSEREETTEQYVRDLESRLKDVDDADESHGVAISDLRKELVRNREAAQSTDLYIKELEGRLAQADEANADLRRQIESLEREVARREESYRELEARVTLLDTSHDSKLLLAEIDDKDRRLHDLERSVDELKSKVDAAEEEAQRLHKLASEEKAVKEELLGRVRTLERTRSNMGPAMTPPRTPGSSSVESSSPEAADVTTSRDAGVLAAHVPLSAGASTDDNLRQQIASLQSTHEQTLRDLEAAQQKYRDSLKEIDDLNGQIQESRLLQTRRSESDFSEMDSHAARGKPGGEEDGAGDAVEQLTDSPTSPRTGSPVVQRPAARTPHARRSMPLSPQRLSFLGRGQGASSPSHLRSASLAQELSSAVFSQTSCPTSPHTVSSSSTSHIRRDSFFGQSERSSEQMKEEVLKLQSALDERDAEIATLEATVQQLRTPDPSGAPSPLRSAGMPLPSIVTERPATPPPDERSTPPSEVLLSPRSQSAFDSLRADLNGTGLGLVALGATDSHRSDQQDQSQRLDELMRSMASKESVHRETVERLEGQLAALQKQHDELAVLSRDQVLNASNEVDRLREEKDATETGRIALERDLAAKSAEVERLQDELAATATRAEEAAKEALVKLEAEVAIAKEAAEAAHRQHLVSLAAEHSTSIDELEASHASALRDAASAHEAELRSKDSVHVSALDELAAQHAEALRQRDLQHREDLQAKLDATDADSKRQIDALLDRVNQLETQLDALSSSGQADVAAAIEKLSAEHASTLAEQQSMAAQERQALQDGHASALDQLRADHASALSELETRHSSALSAQQEERDARIRQIVDDHAHLASQHDAAPDVAGADLEQARRAHADELERIKQEHADVVRKLCDEHEAMLRSHDTDQAAALDRLSTEHAAALADLETKHASAISAQQDAHDARLAQAVEQHAQLVSMHEAALGDAAAKLEQARQEHYAQLVRLQQEHDDDVRALRDEHEASSRQAAESHASVLEEVKGGHDEAMVALEAKHAAALESTRADLTSQHASTVDNLKQDLQRHRDEAAAQHAAALGSLRAELDAARSASSADIDKARQLADELEAVRTSHGEEKERLVADHAGEVKRLLDEHEALRTSLSEAHRTALHEEKEARENALEQAKVDHAAAAEALRSSLAAEHADALTSLSRDYDAKLAARTSDHEAAVANLVRGHDANLQRLRDEHSAVLQGEAVKTQKTLEEAEAAHASALALVTAERDAAKQTVESIRSELASLQDDLAGARDAAASVSNERDSLAQRLDELSTRHTSLIAEHAKELNALRQSLKVQQTAAPTVAAPETQTALASLTSLEQALHESQDDRARLVSQIHELRGGENGVAEDDGRFESMVKQVEQYRAVVTKLDAQLVLTRKEKDTLAAQLARMSLSSSNAGLGISSVQSPTSNVGSRAMSPTSDVDRATSPPLRSERFFSNGSTFSGKLPPPTPPPSVPPPPAPAPTSPLPPVPAGGSPLRLGGRRSSASSTATAATEHRRGSLGGSGESSSASQGGDAKLTAQLKEHEAQLARVKQQLAQRIADYQAQVDLVSTLEQALNDSERNLRKARLQSNEYARERDAHKATVDRLRQEAQDSHTASESYRQSVLDMEERLQEQRTREARAERARMELEARMEAASKRKSKFACF